MAQANPTMEEVTSEQNEDHQVGVETTERDRRERIPTEKGESLRLERLVEERKAAGVALRRQITKVNSLLESIKELDARVLEQERDSLDLCRDRMNDAHHNYYKELHDTKEADEAYEFGLIFGIANISNVALELTKPCLVWKDKQAIKCLWFRQNYPSVLPPLQ